MIAALADDPIVVALAAGALSLGGVVFTAHVNRREHELRRACRQLERGLRSCRRDRLYLRQRGELLLGALLNLLGEDAKLNLLAQLGEHVPPSDADDEDADDWRGT